MRRALLAVVLLVLPAVACASAGELLTGNGLGGAIGGAVGAFLGNVLRDVVWLRKHQRDCPAYRAHAAVEDP